MYIFGLISIQLGYAWTGFTKNNKKLAAGFNQTTVKNFKVLY
jgi:hypothetical protein